MIPLCLQIRNTPAIFMQDPTFRAGFSHLATTCSRHWMVLGIDTAIVQSRKELEEIAELEKLIQEGSSITDAKTLLEKIRLSLPSTPLNKTKK